MAASNVGQVLAKASNSVLQNILPRDATLVGRVLTCYQPRRHRKKLLKPLPWHVKKEPTSFNESLTPENEQFITELVDKTYKQKTSPLKTEPWPRGEWEPRSIRTGVLAVKLGTLPQWMKDGSRVMTTLLQVVDNHVISYSPPEKFQQESGWNPRFPKECGRLVVGALSCDPAMFSKEYNNLFLEAGTAPKKTLTRFIITPNAALEPGTPLDVNHFRVGDYVDCQAKTIERGFQGVMKRWGFSGGLASHGASSHHRRPGPIGINSQKKVWKGHKMAGHMGGQWSTLKGLQIMRINTQHNVLYVKGVGIPGPNYAVVRIMDSVIPKKRELTASSESFPPFPTFYPEDNENVADEIWHESLFNFSSPSITFQPDKVTKRKK